jgi:hypothetical protein
MTVSFVLRPLYAPFYDDVMAAAVIVAIIDARPHCQLCQIQQRPKRIPVLIKVQQNSVPCPTGTIERKPFGVRLCAYKDCFFADERVRDFVR